MWSGLLWSQKPAPKNLSRIGKSYISQQFIERQHQQPTSCTSRKTSSMRACWWLGCKHSVLCLLEFPHAQQTHQSKEPQGSQQSHGLQAARCSWKKNIKLRQHRHQIAKDIFLLASTRSPFLLRHINVVSIRPNTHTAIDISQPPPAATPAPKLHSAHCTLTAVPCSSTQVSKDADNPLTVPCTRTLQLQRHQQASSLWQQHCEEAFCSGTKQRHPATAAPAVHSAHTTPTATPWSRTLQASSIGTSTPAPKRTQHSDSSTLQRHPAAPTTCQLQSAHATLTASSKARAQLWQQRHTSRPAPKRTHHSNSSTLKQHPAAAAPAGQLQSAHNTLTAAPWSSTLQQRHQQARSKAHTTL